jgi:hypothetical protein
MRHGVCISYNIHIASGKIKNLFRVCFSAVTEALLQYLSPMTKLHDLTTSQLHRIIAIKEQVEALQSELATIAGDGGEFPPPPHEPLV